MPIKLSVYKGKDLAFQFEHEFDLPEIKIGREDSNQLVLEDPKKVVSREHSEIKFDNGTYYLSDKGSRNGTYINKNRLKPNYPYVLDEGSEFSIGEYTVKVALTEAKEYREETVFLSNPFVDDIQALQNILHTLEEKYQKEEPTMRNDLLMQAVTDEMGDASKSELLKLLTEKGATREHTPVPVADIPEDGRLVTILLDVVVKLIQVISRFRTEFVGATLVQTKDSLQVNSREELQNYLMDSSISSEEAEKRLSLLRAEIEKVILHQVALLDGYRASIQEGVPELLKELNPAIIKKEIGSKNIELGPLKIPKRIVPLLVNLNTLQIIEQQLYNLSVEDRGIFEKKYFRPAFIKRYLENISAAQRSSSKKEDF
jgi:type VI secretion system protein ImpI